MDQRGDHMKMNFEYFQIQKWILQTVRSEKVDEKNGVICLVSMFPSWVMVCKLSKKVHFYNFVLTSARNLRLLQQFTYMHLKVLITLFQKMIWFIGVWATVHEILAIKISKTMLTQQKFNKIFWFQTLISSEVRNETFQMHICIKLFLLIFFCWHLTKLKKCTFFWQLWKGTWKLHKRSHFFIYFFYSTYL